MNARRAVAGALALVGVGSLGEAATVHAKARLGQLLISRAWQRLQSGGEAVRPWPWADTWPVARLQVPAAGVDLIVLAGATGRTLAWGPGHLAGTAPVGGPGNAVLAGHRDTHFAFLRDLELGSEVRTEDVLGRHQSYRVVESLVTHERDGRILTDTEARRLTLVTCWPFDAALPGGSQRYVVVAEEALGETSATGRFRVDPLPERAGPHAVSDSSLERTHAVFAVDPAPSYREGDAARSGRRTAHRESGTPLATPCGPRRRRLASRRSTPRSRAGSPPAHAGRRGWRSAGEAFVAPGGEGARGPRASRA